MTAQNGGDPRPELPEGWQWRALGDIGTWVGGGTPSKQRGEFWEGGTIPWVSPKDMKTWRLGSTQDAISESGVEGSSAKVFAADSVAVVVRSGILEHTLPVALVPFRATANQDMRVVTPKEEIDADWLMYALQANAETIRRACRKDGTTVASIDVPKLTGWNLPVPPLDEQQRMVALIERHLTSIGTGAQILRQCASLTERLRLSVLQRLASPDTPLMRLDEIGEVFVGATPSRTDLSLWDGDIPWVSSREVAFNRITTTQETISEAGLGDRAKRLQPAGSVLIAMYGEGKTRGQAALLDIDAATNQAVASIQLDPDRALPEFVYYCLMQQYEAVRKIGSGTQQKNLSKRLVAAIEVPCPPTDAQSAAVAEIRALHVEARTLREEVAAQCKAGARLQSAVLNSAFGGDL